jgi:hypothetical protein
VSRVASWATGWGAAVLLVALYWLLATSALARKSTTFDELSHLTAGYSYWKLDTYRLQPETGNLPQRWAALPLLFGHYAFPASDSKGWRTSNPVTTGGDFFYRLGNDVEVMLSRSRAFMGLIAAALGLVVYGWSRSLFGPVGGMVSLLLFVFNPTLLANGPLIDSDTTTVLFFLAAAGLLWRALHRMTPGNVLLSALATGGLCLSKYSAGLLVPMAVLLVALRLLRGEPLPVRFDAPREIVGRPRQALAMDLMLVLQLLVVWMMIWGAFGFRYTASTEPRFVSGEESFEDPWDKLLDDSTLGTKIVRVARDRHLLPEAYVYGLAYVLRHTAARRAFLNGRTSLSGWPTFFPYTVLVKTPLPVFGLLVLAMLAAFQRWRGPTGFRWDAMRDGVYATAPLWTLLAVYWLAAVTSHLNIGHRHVLITYPVVFILMGVVGTWLVERRVVGALLVAALLLAAAIESFMIRPDYLAYFNQLVGGPEHAYRHLVDSSLDWGQEVPDLKRWLDAHNPPGPDHQQVYLSLFGPIDPGYYGIDAQLLPSYGLHEFDGRADHLDADLHGGIYCLSATMLQSVYLVASGPWYDGFEEAYQQLLVMHRDLKAATDDTARGQLILKYGRDMLALVPYYPQFRLARLNAFLRQREPDAEIGYSILVYRLSDDDVNRALFGPPPENIPRTTQGSQ